MLTSYIREFIYFGVKQAYACLFGGALLCTIILTKFLWDDSWAVARYDALFFIAIIIQIILISCKLETTKELRVIFLFHIVGTIMEIFKTHVGSWSYPEENLLRIGGVPLFSGFMYSAVGSYIARVWRIFDFKFTHYPSQKATLIVSLLIYINFFTHHYIIDIRYALFAAIILLFGRTRVYYKPYKTHRWMPLIIGFILVSFFIWIAENVGTFSTTWVYPEQMNGWDIVSLHKMGSWFLLMIISFVMVTWINKITVMDTHKR